MLKIYQSNPTIVFQTDAEVIKAFPTSSDCKAEYQILQRSDEHFLSFLESGERLKSIEIVWVKNSILALKPADGKVLADSLKCQSDFIDIAARLLADRHLKIINEDHKHEGRLLGDFVVDHLFWDSNTKTMTLIDPGANYLIEGNLAEDGARFIFSVFSKFRWNPFRAVKLVSRFAATYLSHSGQGKVHLEKAVRVRFNRSINKFRLQKTFFRAHLGLLLLRLHFFLILLVLRHLNV